MKGFLSLFCFFVVANFFFFFFTATKTLNRGISEIIILAAGMFAPAPPSYLFILFLKLNIPPSHPFLPPLKKPSLKNQTKNRYIPPRHPPASSPPGRRQKRALRLRA